MAPKKTWKHLALDSETRQSGDDDDHSLTSIRRGQEGGAGTRRAARQTADGRLYSYTELRNTPLKAAQLQKSHEQKLRDIPADHQVAPQSAPLAIFGESAPEPLPKLRLSRSYAHPSPGPSNSDHNQQPLESTLDGPSTPLDTSDLKALRQNQDLVILGINCSSSRGHLPPFLGLAHLTLFPPRSPPAKPRETVPSSIQPLSIKQPSNSTPRPETPDSNDFRIDSPQATLGSSPRRADSEVMASVPFRVSGDGRKPNRYENRNPMNTVQCRNGPHCRKFQEGTCHYNHDFGSMAPNGLINAFVVPGSSLAKDVLLSSDSSKRSLNVESPAFTPKIGHAQPVKIGISPKAVAAATFTPRGSGSVTPATISHSKEPSGEFIPQIFQAAAAQFQEFVPGQSFLVPSQLENQPQLQQHLNAYGDPFLTQQNIAGVDTSQTQINPYVQQTPGVGGQSFFQDASSYKHPLNYHLYSSIGPRRDNMVAHQRGTADFFIPDELREDLQRKSEATLQTFANSTLPHSIEYFHSLVALDTNTSKAVNTFGYPSWIYKATSSRDGHTYALRRIEGFRLTSEAAIRTSNIWKRITNASLVQVHDAFTGRWFGDSSLIIVTDYHPRAQTLADKHFAIGRHTHRTAGQITPENELWGYIVQLASALKTIHEGGVAAQTIIASKVLVTSKNRLRLNGCAVFDIIQHEQRKPLFELQRADLQDLGRLILGIAARNQTAHQNTPKALELISRTYSERLRSCLAWLATPPQQEPDAAHSPEPAGSPGYNINTLLTNIADRVVATLDSALHQEDDTTAHLMRELENGRLVRLLTKLNIILERPDTGLSLAATLNAALLNQPSAAWSETGERYYLKLFRDYVFHQVDHDGRPVLDLGHIVTSLNKLDAGIDERIQLVSRDEQNVFVTSFKEVKRGFEAAWAEISKASNPSRR